MTLVYILVYRIYHTLKFKLCKQIGYKGILVIKQVIKLPMIFSFGSQYEDLASNFEHQKIKNIHLSSWIFLATQKKIFSN